MLFDYALRVGDQLTSCRCQMSWQGGTWGVCMWHVHGALGTGALGIGVRKYFEQGCLEWDSWNRDSIHVPSVPQCPIITHVSTCRGPSLLQVLPDPCVPIPRVPFQASLLQMLPDPSVPIPRVPFQASLLQMLPVSLFQVPSVIPSAPFIPHLKGHIQKGPIPSIRTFLFQASNRPFPHEKNTGCHRVITHQCRHLSSPQT